MPRPTEDQLSYQRRTVRLCQIAQAVVTRHNRLDTVTLDDGAVPMLPDSCHAWTMFPGFLPALHSVRRPVRVRIAGAHGSPGRATRSAIAGMTRWRGE
jgi:hypothetical protein